MRSQQVIRARWLALGALILLPSASFAQSTGIIAGVDGISRHQAELTFAMSRHALVDLSQVFNIEPVIDDGERLPPARAGHSLA